MSETIAAAVEIERRVATCDFCSQGGKQCFNSPKSVLGMDRPDDSNGLDICVDCIKQLSELATRPSEAT
jgi:hypothetical protein